MTELALGIAAEPRGGPPDGAAPRILLVDDSQLLQSVALAQLQALGCTPDIVDNGRLALEAVAAAEYDLVLMDCNMPEMDGLEACRAIRRRERGTRHLPIIAMTANDSEQERARCLTAGMDDFLTKPVELAELAAKIDHWTKRTAALPEAVDLEALRGLRALRRPNQPDPIAPLIHAFLAESRLRLADCQEAVEQRDHLRLGAAVHALKGTSGTFGATHLLTLMTQLEQCARPEQIDAAEPILAQARQEFDRVGHALEAFA